MDLNKSYPRSGAQILAGYPWLARMIDKSRAYLMDSLGDYIYPCPIDKELLADLNLTGEEFAELVDGTTTDEEVVARLLLPMDNSNQEVVKWAKEFIENRHDSLKRQAEEEGRTFEETNPRLKAY